MIPENLERTRKCTINVDETIICTLFNEHPVDDMTSPKLVGTFLM